jgi:ribonuclease PH
MQRADGRSPNQLRPIIFVPHFTKMAEGSVLAKFGETHVLCNVTIEESLPPWLRNQPKPHGWLTAEYAMLPRSTQQRTRREQRWPKGRTQEISRLIGRSLRMALDLLLLGERTITVDCDVLQADGGTRTTAICGGWVALQLALRSLIAQDILPAAVNKRQIAAISVGIVDGVPLLDLPYIEDVAAEVDMNVVMASNNVAAGLLVEVQGTGEKAPFSRAEFDQLLTLAEQGIGEIMTVQEQIVSSS